VARLLQHPALGDDAGAARRFPLGSVALKVLSSAPCPVFVVRIQEESRT
jgi:universal stress protein family protein